MRPIQNNQLKEVALERLNFEEIIALGKDKGYITFEELMEHLDEEALTPELIEELITQLDEFDIHIIPKEGEDHVDLSKLQITIAPDTLPRSDDPIVNLEDGTDKKTWETQYFLDKPLVAILTLLSKFQIDVKNSEANLINYLYGQIDAGSFKFNKLGARIIANSNIILQGDVYEAEVFLAAEDSTQQPQIFINNKQVEVIDGKANYKGNTAQPGVFKWSGLIKYKTPSGVIRNYPFEQEFQVVKPSVTMSATRMNVFYLGIKNPFEIGGGAIPNELMDISMTNGKITKTGDAYIIEPTALDELAKRTKVTVYAEIGGKRRVVGVSEWRVKQVPPPVAQINGQSGGDIRKELLAIQDGVMAVLVDFDFDFKYKVTEFEVQTSGVAGYVRVKKSKSNRFTAEQKDMLKRAKIGTIVYISNIKAIGDDSKIRNLDPISFKIR